MEPAVDVRYDARGTELRFAPLTDDKFLIATPFGDISVSLYISEAQAVALYKHLRLYLRSPLTRWGLDSAEAAAKTNRAPAAAR